MKVGLVLSFVRLAGIEADCLPGFFFIGFDAVNCVCDVVRLVCVCVYMCALLALRNRALSLENNAGLLHRECCTGRELIAWRKFPQPTCLLPSMNES